MAYSKETRDRNKKNSELRPDGKGGMVHKSALPKSKREKAKEKIRKGRSKKTGGTRA